MAKDLNGILLSAIEENKIKEKTPDKLPLNPTAEGWSGQEVRRFLAKSLIDNEGSILAEFKKKMIEIKAQFEDVFGEGNGNIQGQIDSIIENIDTVEATATALATTVINNYNTLNATKADKTALAVSNQNINNIKSDVDGLETEIGNIKNGTTIVKKAEQDASGNNIANTYETKAVVSEISTLISSLDLSKLNKEFTSLIEEVSLSLSDVFVVDKGSGARKVSLATIASYLSTQELQLFTIVGELPNENQNPNTIYLLTTENEEGQNQLLEYIWIANQERWELIGSLEVDLSNYYTKTEANELFNNKVDKIPDKGLSTEDYTTVEKNKLAELTVGLTIETWNTDMKTLALSDANKLFLCSYTDNQTLIIPTNEAVSFPIGTMITFSLTSTYTVTFVGANGVTLTSIDSLVTLETQFAVANLIKTDTNTWQLVGAFLGQKKSEPEPIEPSANVVRFVSAASRTIAPKYTNSGVTLEYSVDNGSTWTTIASESETTSAKEHWFRGQATGTKALFTQGTSSNAWAFSGSSDLEVYGNLNFLLCDTLGDEVAPKSLETFAYTNMFSGCTLLTTAPELPATTLASSCYQSMFKDCTSLTTPPELPATTLANRCYNAMFYGCTSLTVAPELPATTLESICYWQMFQNCTSLTTTPELPAISLADKCYQNMFDGCTSLTTAPELPATRLKDYCYQFMFTGCTSLKVSATNTGSYTYAWRIPTSGTGTEVTSWNGYMLTSTGGTFTSNPTIDTTYWVENQPV